MLVSVVVPTHNRPEFLLRTLKSILNQTYDRLQIIVVSNGVSSVNRKVVDLLSDPRLEYYEQENSGGPASPRNHGIQKSKGKYIAFCDDDDLWVNTKIQKQVEKLQQHVDYLFCYTDMIRFDEEKQWSLPHESGQATFHSLLYHNTVPVSSILIDRDILKFIEGFSESKFVGDSEDYEFVLRCAIKTKLYHIDEPLIKYWSGGNRTSCVDFTRNVKKVFKYMITVIRIYFSIYINNQIALRNFIKPSLYTIKSGLKVVLYTCFQKWGFLK